MKWETSLRRRNNTDGRLPASAGYAYKREIPRPR